MSNATRAMLFALITLATTHSAAIAQLGPWVEQAPVGNAPIDRPLTQRVLSERPVAQPAVEPQAKTAAQVVETPAHPSSNASKPLGVPRAMRSDATEQGIGTNAPTTPLKLGKEFIRTVATLAGVLMLIFALAHFYKRLARTRGGLSGQIGAGGRAPSGLVEVLGRYPISSGMTLVVMRFDRKILLLSHASAGRGKRGGTGSMQTLCEMSSPEEVASILGKVRDEAGDSIAASFERTLQEAGNATDKEIAQAMYQPSPGVHVQRPRRIAPGFVSNDEGDRLELTSQNDSPAASQVLRRRLGAMRRGN